MVTRWYRDGAKEQNQKDDTAKGMLRFLHVGDHFRSLAYEHGCKVFITHTHTHTHTWGMHLPYP